MKQRKQGIVPMEANPVSAVCSVPVQVYISQLRGLYEVGDVLTGERASLALDRYPEYFVPGSAEKEN